MHINYPINEQQVIAHLQQLSKLEEEKSHIALYKALQAQNPNPQEIKTTNQGKLLQEARAKSTCQIDNSKQNNFASNKPSVMIDGKNDLNPQQEHINKTVKETNIANSTHTYSKNEEHIIKAVNEQNISEINHKSCSSLFNPRGNLPIYVNSNLKDFALISEPLVKELFNPTLALIQQNNGANFNYNLTSQIAILLHIYEILSRLQARLTQNYLTNNLHHHQLQDESVLIANQSQIIAMFFIESFFKLFKAPLSHLLKKGTTKAKEQNKKLKQGQKQKQTTTNMEFHYALFS